MGVAAYARSCKKDQRRKEEDEKKGGVQLAPKDDAILFVRRDDALSFIQDRLDIVA